MAMAGQIRMLGGAAAACCGVLCALACASDPDPGDSATDAAVETQSPDVAAEAEDEAGVSVPLCQIIGDEKVQSKALALGDAYAGSVFDDCRVVQIFLPLSPDEGTEYLMRLATWTMQFMGCEHPGVTNFGPADTGKFPTLSQADVDLLSDLYVAQLELYLQLTPEQVSLVRQTLVPLASAAVNMPGTGHSLSLCPDGGADGGADASPDASPDAGADVVDLDVAADGQDDVDLPDAGAADSAFDAAAD